MMTIDNECFKAGLIVGAASSRTPKSWAIYGGAVYNPDDIGISKVYIPINKPDLPEGFVSPRTDFKDVLEHIEDKQCFWNGFFHAKRRSLFIPGLFSNVAIVIYSGLSQASTILDYLLSIGVQEVFIQPNRSKENTAYELIMVIDNEQQVELFVETVGLKSNYLTFLAKLFV